MILSGAICGLIGLLLTAGTDHTLTTTIVGGRGFTAVMVSWMAKFNPIMMIFTSLLIVVLSRGASEISSVFSLNHSFADILTGIISSSSSAASFSSATRSACARARRRREAMTFDLTAFLPRAVMQGIPLLYGSTGEILTEKSGNLNLGIPGVMYVGGICGVIGAFFYEQSTPAADMNAFLAIGIPMLCSLLGSLLMGLLYCLLTVTLRANQNVTGLALTTFASASATSSAARSSS